MRKAQLKIERGPRAGDEINLDGSLTCIGCDNRNDLPIADHLAALFHASIRRRDRMFILEDLGSAAGTFLNGDRIRNTVLKNGDRILIGTTEMVFWAEDEVDFDTGIRRPDNAHAVEFEKLNFSKGASNEDFASPNVNNSYDDRLRPVLDLGLNIAGTDASAEAGFVLLRGIPQLFPAVARAAFLLYDAHSHRFKTLVSKQFHKHGMFHATKAMLQDVVRTKNVMTFLTQPTTDDTTCWQIAILPMMSSQTLLGVVQLEWPREHNTPDLSLAPIQALLALSTSHFELMRMRVEQEHAVSAYVRSLSATLEAKDTYTGGHSERVARYCLAMAEEMKLDAETSRFLLMSAVCHDVGKLAIPDVILRKPGLLSVDEYEEMKTHPDMGTKILSGVPHLARFVSGIRHHHERWDGTGYPDGLTGEQIPFFARIIAITDAFDAIVSGRNYAGFADVGSAVDYLQGRDDLFDAELLRVFTTAYEKGRISTRTDTQHHNLEIKINEKSDEKFDD